MQKKSELFNVPVSGIAGRLTLGLFCIFLTVTSIIAALSATTMFYPHSILVSIWSFKEAEYHQLLHFRFLAGGGFGLLSVMLASAAIGWFNLRRWAWFLSSIILTVNIVSDVGHMIATKEWVDALGVLLEGLILLWVTSRQVRNRFLQTYEHLNDDCRE